MTQAFRTKIAEAAKPFKPLAYVVAGIGTLLGGLVGVRVSSDESNPLWYCSEQLIVPLILALACLLGLWLWFGISRWPIRVPVVLAGFAGIERVALIATGEPEAAICYFPWLAALIVTLVTIWIVLHLLQVRLKLAPATRIADDWMISVGSGRFYIFDLLTWTAAAALIFGMGRSIPWEYAAVQWANVVLFLAIGFSCAVGALVALWAVFGSARLPLRLLGLFAATPLVAWAVTGFWTWYNFGGLAWIYALELVVPIGVQSVFVATALIVFRAFGYQIVRLPVSKLEA